MLGAVAAGPERGGHASFADAARAMSKLKPERVTPDPGRAAAYDVLYRDWLELHDYFGRGTDIMRRLKKGVRPENSIVSNESRSTKKSGLTP
jgi:L-ribulokinase